MTIKIELPKKVKGEKLLEVLKEAAEKELPESFDITSESKRKVNYEKDTVSLEKSKILNLFDAESVSEKVPFELRFKLQPDRKYKSITAGGKLSTKDETFKRRQEKFESFVKEIYKKIEGNF